MNTTKRKILIILLVTVGIIAIAAGTATQFMKNNSTKSDQKNTISSKAFFLKNKEGYYALFDTTGKQLTDFIFSKVEDFYNHTSVVITKDGKSGIIKDNGKYLVNLGKYKKIYSTGPLYNLITNDNKNKYMNSEGEQILTNATSDYSLYQPTNSQYLYLFYNSAELKILNYDGKQIDNIKTYRNASTINGTLTSEADTSDDENYSLLTYNSTKYLYNLKNNKRIMTFDTSYSITSVSEDSQKIIVSSDENHVVIENDKKILEIPISQCDSLSFLEKGYICGSSSSSLKTLLDKAGNPVAENVIAYINYSNYIVQDKNNNHNYNFYENEKLKKTIRLLDIENGKTNIAYLAKTYDNSYSYYTSIGEKLNDSAYLRGSTKFNKDGYAIAKTAMQKYNIINKDGKDTSTSYQTLYQISLENYYCGTNGSTKYLLDSNGNIIAQGFNNYEYIQTKETLRDKIFIIYEDRTEIYNVQKKKVVATINTTGLKFDSYYAYEVTGDTTNYYSYENGGKFYTLSET